ncbi:uncharacterized protein LOC131162818 [Malania oleifera]|uniref:uncharacterized protein LOC131162818 n=1 Tax=Malania oleifera TaxID=397392 RepID=UPI0025AE026A|nr:uncharacterized protein LOC131162818 [Malania oleifera]
MRYEKYDNGWILKGSRGQVRPPPVTAFQANYSSLDDHLGRNEKHLASSSHPTDPMDISSAPASDNGSDEEDSKNGDDGDDEKDTEEEHGFEKGEDDESGEEEGDETAEERHSDDEN